MASRGPLRRGAGDAGLSAASRRFASVCGKDTATRGRRRRSRERSGTAPAPLRFRTSYREVRGSPSAAAAPGRPPAPRRAAVVSEAAPEYRPSDRKGAATPPPAVATSDASAPSSITVAAADRLVRCGAPFERGRRSFRCGTSAAPRGRPGGRLCMRTSSVGSAGRPADPRHAPDGSERGEKSRARRIGGRPSLVRFSQALSHRVTVNVHGTGNRITCISNRRTAKFRSYSLPVDKFNGNGHTTLTTPVLVRSPKLSSVGRG